MLILHKQRHERNLGILDDAQESEVIRYGIAADIVRLSQRVTSKSNQSRNEEFGPLALNAAYHTAVAYLEMGSKNINGEHLQGLREIKSLLTLTNKRWKLAGKFSGPFNLQSGQASAKQYIILGVYLKLIEAREAMYPGNL